jgi:hypothetical protein
MLSLKLLRMTVHLRPDVEVPAMVLDGHCGACGKEVSRILFIYDDETAREAFDWFWESLAEDCELSHKTLT